MSIIGNPIMAGGGKNISSIIITGLSSTDTVTCTKDGKSYTAAWDATSQHWEIVGLPLGTFTITATRGTDTTTETVLIDISGVYEIEMVVRLWLYRDGDEFEDMTGGWYQNQSAAFLNGYFNGSYQLVKNDDSLYLPTVYTGCSNATTINTIDMSQYTKLCVEAKSDNADAVVNLFPVITTDLSNYPKQIETPITATKATYVIDISSYNDQAYLAFVGYSTQPHYIYKVWLEK